MGVNRGMEVYREWRRGRMLETGRLQGTQRLPKQLRPQVRTHYPQVRTQSKPQVRSQVQLPVHRPVPLFQETYAQPFLWQLQLLSWFELAAFLATASVMESCAFILQ